MKKTGQNRYFFLSIMVLVLVDQICKIIISDNYIDYEFDIFKNIIAFKPHLNTEYSWINSILNLGIGLEIHLAFIGVLFFVIFFTFDYIRSKKSDSYYVRVSFALLVSGVICATIDMIFWGGSLDFIWLKGYFIFDIKDCYVTLFEIIIIILIIINFKAVNSFSVKNFIKHILKRLRNLKINN